MRQLLFICLLLLALPARGAEWGVLPIPRESDVWSVNDYVDALNMVKSINAPVQVSVNGWGDLEPETNKYAIDQHLGGLAYGHGLGLQPYFGISVINTTRRDMPADLISLRWNDPALLGRFEKLLDATREKIPENLSVLIIGNEVDVYLEQHPDEIDDYLAFYAKASAAARQRYPQARIGVTVTYEGLIKGRADIISPMISISDAAFFTFYPLFDMKAQPVASVPSHLDRLQQAAQGKDIYLQEVGYPSSSLSGSSEAQQAEFFATAIPAINARPQIKLASIFLLHDLSPKLCQGLTAYYGFGDAGHFANLLSDFLCSLGVRRLDGTPKPAFETISALLLAR